jgi:D-alanine-D-alanine ligase
MDKAVMKVLFHARGLRVPASMTIRRSDWRAGPAAVAAGVERALPYPLFIKPANLGSSVGISKVHQSADLPRAIELAAEYDHKVIVEAAVPDAREIECAVLGNERPEASVPGEILPSREFYDYEAKYIDDRSRLEIPAALDPPMAEEIRRQSIVAFEAIDASGLARVDFLLSRRTGELFVNEINTMPGFTTISMYAKLWAASGLAYATLVDRLVALALERHAAKQELKTSTY